jgi:hypothetical protein
MFGEGFEMLGAMVAVLFWVAVISVPLAIWKAVEIVVWVCSHLQWVS